MILTKKVKKTKRTKKLKKAKKAKKDKKARNAKKLYRYKKKITKKKGGVHPKIQKGKKTKKLTKEEEQNLLEKETKDFLQSDIGKISKLKKKDPGFTGYKARLNSDEIRIKDILNKPHLSDEEREFYKRQLSQIQKIKNQLEKKGLSFAAYSKHLRKSVEGKPIIKDGTDQGFILTNAPDQCNAIIGPYEPFLKENGSGRTIETWRNTYLSIPAGAAGSSTAGHYQNIGNDLIFDESFDVFKTNPNQKLSNQFCWLCGLPLIKIPNAVPQCEHILPVSEGQETLEIFNHEAHATLLKKKEDIASGGPPLTHEENLKINKLLLEYGWAHSICNNQKTHITLLTPSVVNPEPNIKNIETIIRKIIVQESWALIWNRCGLPPGLYQELLNPFLTKPKKDLISHNFKTTPIPDGGLSNYFIKNRIQSIVARLNQIIEITKRQRPVFAHVGTPGAGYLPSSSKVVYYEDNPEALGALAIAADYAQTQRIFENTIDKKHLLENLGNAITIAHLKDKKFNLEQAVIKIIEKFPVEKVIPYYEDIKENLKHRVQLAINSLKKEKDAVTVAALIQSRFKPFIQFIDLQFK